MIGYYIVSSAGHLSEHISGHPTHQQYYSNKLKRLVKIHVSLVLQQLRFH